MKANIAELQLQHNMLEKKVATLKKYEDYLEKVTKSGNSAANDQQQAI